MYLKGKEISEHATNHPKCDTGDEHHCRRRVSELVA
jgi:hypothetical protein